LTGKTSSDKLNLPLDSEFVAYVNRPITVKQSQEGRWVHGGNGRIPTTGLEPFPVTAPDRIGTSSVFLAKKRRSHPKPGASTGQRHERFEEESVIGFLIIVSFQLLGMGLHKLGVPLPGGVLGLILFTTALATGLIKLKWVERTATFLVRHMLLLFIPVMAGLPQMSAELRHDGVALLASLIVSLLAVLLTTGGLAHLLLRDVKDDNPRVAKIAELQ
jgi:holin-like protein